MIDRRRFLRRLTAAGVLLATRAWPESRTDGEGLLRPIPSSGERLPAVGMGSWITFNVARDEQARAVRAEVLRAFFDLGGTLIDSSPMYGSSEDVIGDGLASIGRRDSVFAATKVWTRGKDYGIRQMSASERLWGVDRIDLMQVHNLLVTVGVQGAPLGLATPMVEL